MVRIYTDGSSRQTNGVWIGGYACWVEDTDTLWGDGLYNLNGTIRATVNLSETTGLLSAIQYAKKHYPNESLTVITDSTYVINGLNRLKTNGSLPKTNSRIWRLVQMELKGVSVTIEKVAGHTGIHGNELADKKAGQERNLVTSTLQLRGLL